MLKFLKTVVLVFPYLSSHLKYCVFILAFPLLCFGQDPVFSQFYNAPLQLNPAFAGNTNAPLFHLNYRNQWPALGNIYTTYAVSYDQFFRKLNSGLGIALLADNSGDGILSTIKLAATYAYRMKINNTTYIKGGIEAAYGNMSLNWDRLTFGDGIDPRFGNLSPGGAPFPSAEIRPDQSSIHYLNISSGVLLSNPLYYIGISLRNLNTPDISFLKDENRQANKDGFIPLRYSLHGGMQIVLKKGNKQTEDTFLSPNILFTSQAGFSQINIGTILSVDKIFGGLWYRLAGNTNDALIGSVGVKKDFFKISYSFDYTTSALSINQGGSHEVGIVLNFDAFYSDKPDYNDCFSIFR